MDFPVSFKTSPFGIDGKSAMGVGISYSFGWNYKVSTNPIGMLGEFESKAHPNLEVLTNILAGLLGGDVGFNVGAGVKFNYGPSFEFKKGRKVDFDPTGTLVEKPAKLLAAAVCLTNLASTVLSSYSVVKPPKDMKDWIQSPLWSMPVLCLAALTMVENMGYTTTKTLRLQAEQQKQQISADTARRLEQEKQDLLARIERIEDALREKKRGPLARLFG
jgi:hypothetical protein